MSIIHVDVDALRTLVTKIQNSASTIETEMGSLTQQTDILENAIQGVSTDLATKLQELRTMYQRISQSLQEHQGFVNGVITETEQLIERIKSTS